MTFRPLTAPYAESVNLPANINSVPASLPSKPIERLLTKREKGHNAIINAIKLSCQKYSAKIEDEIEKKCSHFIQNFSRDKCEIQNKLATILVPQDEIINLNLERFETVVFNIQNINSRRLKKVDDLFENLKNLERRRSNRFKSILNDGYRKTSKISHLLPYELLNFFEKKITELNEITMNNYYYYTKIHADFKLQAQEDLRVALLQVQDVRKKFMVATKMTKVKNVMEAHKRENYESKFPDLDLTAFSVNVPHTPSDLQVWTKEVKRTLDNLDANAKKLLSLYKMAVLHIFNRFFSELTTITEELTENKAQKPSLEQIPIESEIFQTVIEDITDLYKCDVTDLKNLWNSITEYMESNIENTNIFLTRSTRLWDGHFKRVAEGKKIILEEIDLMIDKHNKAADSFDKKINTTLDKLRQGSTLAKLDHHLKEIHKFLDSFEKLYKKQCEEEISVLNKYHSLVDQGIDLLISEIDEFLSQNVNNENIDQRKASWISLAEDHHEYTEPECLQQNLIPHQMQICQVQVNAVNNWMLGLWETIRSYMLTCRKEMTECAHNWMLNSITKLKKRLQVRLATLKPRYQRVKTMIYDVRLKELKDHKDSYQRVQNQVARYISDSKNFNKTSQGDRILIFDDFGGNMQKIEEKLKSATKSQHVGVCIEQYKKISSEVNHSLLESFDENFKQLQNNLDNIDGLISNFAESIKIFSDGGDYSRDEAKTYKRKIIKLKKRVPKKYTRILAEYNKLQPQIMKQFNHTDVAVLSRMNLSKREFEHNEKICEKISDLRLKIRNSAYDVKFKIHRIDAEIDYYEEVSQMDIWKRELFDIMKEAIEDCLEKIITLTNYLIGKKYNNENGYLYELDRMINDSYKEIENIAKEFYDTHGTVINVEKVQSNHQDFMNEVKKNYEGFQIQVEIHCLECVNNLIEHILKLLKVNDGVYKGLIEKFPDIRRVRENDYDRENELSLKLCQESVNLEESKKHLEENKIAGSSIVKNVILKNEDRVSVLQSLILELMEFLSRKVSAMEEVVQDIDGRNRDRHI